MRWTVGVVVVALLPLSPTNVDAEVVIGPNDHAYELVQEPMPWHDALAAAVERSGPEGFGTGHLATISDDEENAFLFSTIAVNLRHSFWMGFTDEAVEGEWHWIDDTPGIWQDPDNFADPIQTAFTNWDNLEPNDRLGEDAALMNGGVDTWNDGQVVTPFVYVVEWEEIILPQPGDTDNDLDVDIADLNNVRNHFGDGEILGPPVFGEAFPFNGVVDLGDLNLVRNFFGTSTETAAVPEPSTFALALLLTIIVLASARRPRIIRHSGIKGIKHPNAGMRIKDRDPVFQHTEHAELLSRNAAPLNHNRCLRQYIVPLTIVLVVFLAPRVYAASYYRFTQIGDIGTRAHDINSHGQVVGVIGNIRAFFLGSRNIARYWQPR